MKNCKFKLIYLCLVLCLAFFYSELSAQKEASIWCFGIKCGLDFNYTPPVQLDGIAMVTQESCSSISDKDGNLLFYTNGVTVWNRNHKQMPNGYGLKGHISSNQGTIIIPQPLNDSIYYIFSTGAIESYPQKTGLFYSVVDVTKDSGYGDVIEKNIPLHSNSSEALNAVLHADGEGIWVGSILMPDLFVATLVNKMGIQMAKYTQLHHLLERNNMWGSMKFSPNGKYLAVTYPYFEPAPGVALYEFNNEIGTIKFITYFNSYRTTGISFTNNSTSLIVRENHYQSKIWEYELLNIIQTHKPNTKTLLTQFPDCNCVDGLELSIDGSIYIPLIKKTNDSGALFYHHSVRSISQSKSNTSYSLTSLEFQFHTHQDSFWLRLPNFIQSYFDPFFQAGLGNDTVVCAGTPVALSYYPGASVLWSTGDTTELLTVTEPGIYSVIAAHPDNPGWIRHDTITITHKPCTDKCNELQTWPNPNQGQFTVSVEAAVPATLELFARNGQLIESEILETNHTNPYPIASRLGPGTYLLRYANEVCQETVKVVVIKKQ